MTRMAFIGRPILPKLAERLKIRQDATQTLEFSPQLVPVVDIETILASRKGQKTDSAVTARTDTYTVPAGKQWHVTWLHTYRGAASSMLISRVVSGTSYDFYGSATYSGFIQTPCDIWLNAGDSIVFRNDTGASGQIITTIHYDEYDLQ